MNIKAQAKEITPVIGILAVCTVASLCGIFLYREYVEYSFETSKPPVDFSGYSEMEDIQRQLAVIEDELETLTAEVVEGSGFGLWGLEHELGALGEDAEAALREFEL